MRPSSAVVVGRYRAAEVASPYSNLVNTPGTSQNELSTPVPTMIAHYIEIMKRFARTLWRNFKRPHVLSKLVILALSSTVLACYVSVYPWVFQLGNHHQMVLTHVTCGAMLAVTSATWLGHVFGQDTPRYLSMLYGVIGTVLFLAVSGVCFAAYGHRPRAATHFVIPGLHSDGYLNSGLLLTTAILALCSGAAYVADIVILVRCIT